MNLATFAPGRALRVLVAGARWPAFVAGLLALLPWPWSSAFAQAQAPLVYATQRAFITQDFHTEYQGLAIYQWPRLDRVALHPEVPEHDHVLVSPGGRELYLFSASALMVVDRASLRVLRNFPRPSAVMEWWGREAMISPRRPDLLILQDGYWLDLDTGLVVKTPADLAPGFRIYRSQLDDAGELVTLEMNRRGADGVIDNRARVVNLEGRPVFNTDFSNASVVAFSDSRIAVLSYNNNGDTLRVLDPRTQVVVQNLSVPPHYLVLNIAADGRGGLLMAARRDGLIDLRARLFHYPGLQREPVALHDFIDHGANSLRVQGNKVLFNSHGYEICLVGVCGLQRGHIYVHDLSNGEGYSLEEMNYEFGIYDAALFNPRGLAQPSTVPTMGTWASWILGGLLMLFAWRTLARMRDTIAEPARAWHRT